MTRFSALPIALTLIFGAMACTAQTVSEAPKELTKAELEAEHQSTLAKMELFGEVMAIVKDNYVEETDDEKLVEAALNGALSGLDPHSGYSPPAVFTEQRKAVRREYGGLGIEVLMENDYVKVNYAIEDGPAYAAGIRRGDLIVAVDGETTKGKILDDAVSGMRGLAGEPVKVTVRTAGRADREVEVVRQVVRGRAVRHRVEDGLGYIFIDTFNNNKLTSDIKRALSILETDLGGNIPGLVIDLRGNRGGLLDQSVSVSGLFLDGGEVLSARGRSNADTERYHAEAGELYPKMPIVVLVSPGSASAAEIVAGALQDRGRAVVVGRRTFGKGSVQSVIPLESNRGALRMTTQRYYTPSGKSIQGRGIMPDSLVAAAKDTGKIRKRFREDSLPHSLINPDDTDYEERYEDVLYPPEDHPTSEDFQLQQAIKILQSQTEYAAVLKAQSGPFSN